MYIRDVLETEVFRS